VAGSLHRTPIGTPLPKAPADPAQETQTARPAAPSGAGVGAPDLRNLTALGSALGNRQLGRYGRMLARDTSVTVYLVGPPPPVHAVERETPENRALAKAIDEIDALSDADLKKRRDDEASKASKPDDKDAAQHELYLEAIEFVARRRGFKPMLEDYSNWKTASPSRRRLNVRLLIQQGIEETGSFDQAIDKLTSSKDIESDIAYFKKMAEGFKHDFKGQAWLTAERMLKGSLSGMGDVLAAYGIPRDTVAIHATKVARGADAKDEAEEVVKSALLSTDINNDEYKLHRHRLAEWVQRLKEHQQKVRDATVADNKATMDAPISGEGPKWDAVKETHKKLAVEQGKLDTLWIQAERLHPVLAAYRRGGKLVDVDLGKLDTEAVDDRMRDVVAEVLPKIADIAKAQTMIFKDRRKSPLAIPSVAAMTRSNMFIPPGSIRFGVANDLVKEAQESDPWWLKVGAIVLALVTLIPSGGTSLGIVAGVAGASLAAYSATKAWAEYTQQKTLANTDLDIARSLSTEEPSLTGFAVSLVALGIEAIPMVSAFHKAMEIKRLAAAGEDFSGAVRELNLFGKKHGAPDLGDQALRDIKAEQREAKAAEEAHGAPKEKEELHEGGGKTTPKEKAPVALKAPPGAKHATVEELRKGIQSSLAKVAGKGADNLNKEWLALKKTIRAGIPKTTANEALLKDMDKVYAAVRSPKFVEDTMVDVWQTAAREQKSAQAAMEEMAGATGGRKLPDLHESDASYEEFNTLIKGDLPFLDKAFATDYHGEFSHVFQELVVAKALGGRDAARAFRHLVAEATGPERLLSTGKKQPFWSQVWDGIFDAAGDEAQLNSPEWIGPIIHEHLGLPGPIRRK
jgi:hypothetical protein